MRNRFASALHANTSYTSISWRSTVSKIKPNPRWASGMVVLILCGIASAQSGPEKLRIQGQTTDASSPSSEFQQPRQDTQVQRPQTVAEAGILNGSKQPAKPIRLGQLGSTLTGATGLFTVFDAYTINAGEFRVSASFNYFRRSTGNISVSQIPINFSVGLKGDRVELFGKLTPYQRTIIGTPSDLSGAILISSLPQSLASFRDPFTRNTNGFFPLTGLPVGGALGGGVLPGVAQGAPTAIFDPTLARFKNVFPSAAFLNEYPFLGKGGTSWSDTTIGIKVRFTDVNEKEPESAIFAGSVLAYYTMPSQRAGSFASDPFGSRLTRGGSSGADDFAVFLVGSSYKPRNNPKLGVGSQLFNDTINNHINLGYIHRNDPKFDGIRLLKRQDSFVFGYGFDTQINQYVQAIGEAKYERLLGGGTPNLTPKNLFELTIGPRFYPFGTPSLKCLESGETEQKRRRLFLSAGAAYRLTLNQENEIDFSHRPQHGFLFQLTLGRVKNNGRTQPCSPRGTTACDKDKYPLNIKSISTDKGSYENGETMQLTSEIEDSAFKDELKYKWTINGIDQPLSSEAKLSFQVNGFAENQEYTITLRATYKFGGDLCSRGPVTARFKVIPPTPKPKLTVSTVINNKPTVVEGTPADFEAVITGLPSEIRPGYEWRLADADGTSLADRIISGANTPRITVRTDGLGDRKLLAQLQLRDLPEGTTGVDQARGEMVITVCSQNLKIAGSAIVTEGMLAKFMVSYDHTPAKVIPRWVFSWQNGANEPQERTVEGLEAELDTKGLLAGRPKRTAPLEVNVVVTLTGIINIEPGCKTEDSYVLRVFNPVLFATNKYALRKNEKQKLNAVADLLIKEPDKSLEIRVEGNADRRWTAKHNCLLGCRRANASKTYLASKGIESKRMSVASYGKHKAKGGTAAGLQKDRRVDLFVHSSEVTPDVTGRMCDCPPPKTVRRTRKRWRSRE